VSKRRVVGEGSIFKRKSDGMWVGALQIEGKRKAVYGRTPVAVRDKLTVLKARIEAGEGLPRRDERMTVGPYLAAWLERGGSPQPWRVATRNLYEVLVRVHIIPALGKIRLTKLSPADVEEWSLRDMAQASPRLRQMAYFVLRNAMNRALNLEIIRRNPCKCAPAAPAPQTNVLTHDQVTTFLEAARSEPVMRGEEVVDTRVHRLYALYHLALRTGMRQGEMLGLRWQDIDLRNRFLTVNHTLVQDNDGRLVLGEPKTPQSRRRIELGAFDVRALEEHEARMAAEGRWRLLKVRGEKIVRMSIRASEYVFCDTHGKPLRRDNLRKRSFEPILERAKAAWHKNDHDVAWPHIRFHDLRATLATNWSRAGVPLQLIVQRLGHSSPRTTLERYAHATPTMQREWVDRLDADLG